MKRGIRVDAVYIASSQTVAAMGRHFASLQSAELSLHFIPSLVLTMPTRDATSGAEYSTSDFSSSYSTSSPLFLGIISHVTIEAPIRPTTIGWSTFTPASLAMRPVSVGNIAPPA